MMGKTQLFIATALCIASAQQLFLAPGAKAGLKLDVPVYLFHSHLNADFALLREAPRDSDVANAVSYTLFDTEPVGFMSDNAFASDEVNTIELRTYWSASRQDVQTTDWSLEEFNSHGGDYVLLGSLGHIVTTDVLHYVSGAPLAPLWNVFSDARQDEITSPLTAADVNAIMPASPFRSSGRQLGFVRKGTCARCNVGLSETFPSGGGADCMNPCPSGTSSFTSIYHLGNDIVMSSSPAFHTFNAAMIQAGNIIKSFDSSADVQSGKSLHMSFGYMCCYSDQDKTTIRNVLSKIEWPLINVSYGEPAWRIDNRPDHFSVIVLLDDESNMRMIEWVSEVESAIESAGVPIHMPRAQQEPFHTTLGVVKGSTFPLEKAVAAINDIVPRGTWTGTLPLEVTKPEW